MGVSVLLFVCVCAAVCVSLLWFGLFLSVSFVFGFVLPVSSVCFGLA